VPRKIVALFLNTSPPIIQKYEEDPRLGFPKRSAGTYNLLECILWNYHRLRGDDGKDRYRKEMEGKIKAERELKEMELAEKRREVVSISWIIDILTGVHLAARNKLLSLPTRLAPQAVGLTAREIQQLTSDFVDEALNELSRGYDTIGSNSNKDRDNTSSSRGLPASASANRSGLGGSKPDPLSGIKRGARKMANRKSGISTRDAKRRKRR